MPAIPVSTISHVTTESETQFALVVAIFVGSFLYVSKSKTNLPFIVLVPTPVESIGARLRS